MRTVGVDLSVQPRHTAVATVDWGEAGAVVAALEWGVDDEALTTAIADADFCGIDSPLGWPRQMAAAVAAHARGEAFPELTKDEFRHRRTDRFVIERTRELTGAALHPLSVAADRIALPAWRLAAVRERVAERTGSRFDLAGADGVFEVYPAAGLVLWGLPRGGYKSAGDAGRERRAELLAALEARVPLVFDDRPQTPSRAGGGRPARQARARAREMCVAADHPLDAVLAALLARAAATARSYAPPRAADREAARAEGWIHLPEVSLEALAG